MVICKILTTFLQAQHSYHVYRYTQHVYTPAVVHMYPPPTHTHTHDYTQFGTALHFALAGEHEDIVQLLLEAKIDPDLPKQVCHLT